MKNHQIVKLLFCLIVFIFKCNNSTEPEKIRPGPPEIIPKSSDEAIVETGIDAIPEGFGIFLEWSLPQDNQIKWIKIYRKSMEEAKFLFLSSESSVDTFFIDYEINQGITYYYYLVSVSRNRMESLPSDTVHYKLYPKPSGLSHTSGPQPFFSWHYSAIPPIGYLLRLEDYNSGDLIWLSLVARVYDPIVRVVYNWDGNALADSLPFGGRFRWRVDILGSDLFSGSESNWKLLDRGSGESFLKKGSKIKNDVY